MKEHPRLSSFDGVPFATVLSEDQKDRAATAAANGAGLDQLAAEFAEQITNPIIAIREGIRSDVADCPDSAKTVVEVIPALTSKTQDMDAEEKKLKSLTEAATTDINEINKRIQLGLMKAGEPSLPEAPDPIKSSLIVGGLTIFETLAIMLFFIAGSFLQSNTEALLAGAMISITNMGLSTCIIGCYLCRPLFEQQVSEEAIRKQKRAKPFYIIGLLITGMVLIYFHYLIGYVRATGDFDFVGVSWHNVVLISENFYAQMSIILGVTLSVIAIDKGMRGFGGKYAGLHKLKAQVENITGDIEDSCDDGLNGIQDAWEKGHKAIAEFVEAGRRDDKQRRKLVSRHAQLEDLIHWAPFAYENLCAQAQGVYHQISPKCGDEAKMMPVAPAVWQALRSDFDVPTSLEVDPSALNQVRQRFDDKAKAAMASVSEILNSFNDENHIGSSGGKV